MLLFMLGEAFFNINRNNCLLGAELKCEQIFITFGHFLRFYRSAAHLLHNSSMHIKQHSFNSSPFICCGTAAEARYIS